MKQNISITDENVEIITHYISQRTDDAVIRGALASTAALISQNNKITRKNREGSSVIGNSRLAFRFINPKIP